MADGQMTHSTYEEIDLIPGRVETLETAVNTTIPATYETLTDAAKQTAALAELIDTVGHKNVIDLTADTQTVNTVTLTKNADGSYTVQTSSATTAQVAITLGTAELTAGVQYVFSGISGGSTSTFFLNFDHARADGAGNVNVYESGYNVEVGNADRTSTVKLYVRSGQEVDFTLKPMICKKVYWDVSQKFVPYQA